MRASDDIIPDSSDSDVHALRILEKILEKSEKTGELLLEALDNAFKNGEENE